MESCDSIKAKPCNLLSSHELVQHIQGCSLNNRESQKKIFSSFYGYAISICNRYTSNAQDAAEILNDGFLKIFKQIHRFVPSYANEANSFKGWLAKIMIYTAIDHNRKQRSYKLEVSLDEKPFELAEKSESALDKISCDEIINAIQKLTPGYRIIVNMYIIDGFTHEEIARKLNISTGTSKSNLAKAKKHLQKTLLNYYKPVLVKNAT
jgi:RNA polymerase sigma factor (sigma-70 family)